MRCKKVLERMPLLVDDTIRENRRIKKHLSQCLRCQAELAKYRKMERFLDELAFEWRDIPPEEAGKQGVLASTSSALVFDNPSAGHRVNPWLGKRTGTAIPTGIAAIVMSLITLILMIWQRSAVHRLLSRSSRLRQNGAHQVFNNKGRRVTALFSNWIPIRYYPTLLTRQSIK